MRETVGRYTGEDVLVQKAKGAQDGLPLDYLAVMVLTGPGRSKAEEPMRMSTAR